MSSKPDKRIVRFIRKHHVLTLCTESNGQPWCASCFYAYNEDKNLFFYTTDPITRHARETSANQRVAANIVLETRIVGKIQGLQMSGKTFAAEGNLEKLARETYLWRFPYAHLIDLHLWVLEPDFMKLTDNRLGFGTKLIWENNTIS
ncbi:MAG TPA: pyridoxamine 5'-phosphate oxidase family protein [Salinivirgaceae bacterium]|nr:pyridoxamine 5'-phosphate oxidase family protein [Salinivirgaceae bacterium]